MGYFRVPNLNTRRLFLTKFQALGDKPDQGQFDQTLVTPDDVKTAEIRLINQLINMRFKQSLLFLRNQSQVTPDRK